MSWRVSIRNRAEVDISQALDWYDRIDRHLGGRFLDEIADAVNKLESDPHHQQIYYGNFRRLLLTKFPYKLFYQIIDERVVVFRVLHASQ